MCPFTFLRRLSSPASAKTAATTTLAPAIRRGRSVFISECKNRGCALGGGSQVSGQCLLNPVAHPFSRPLARISPFDPATASPYHQQEHVRGVLPLSVCLAARHSVRAAPSRRSSSVG